MRMSRFRSAPHLLPLLLLFFITLIMTFPIIFHLQDHLPSDLGDPLYHAWLMGKFLAKVKDGFTNFWDGGILYPHQKTILYADYTPALSLLATLPALLTKNLILTYNLIWLLSFFLSGLGAYFLVFHLTSSRSAAFISSIIFAFLPVNFAHLSHLELLFSAWIPFSFLFLHRYFKHPNLKNLALTLFFLVLQALSCAHYGIYAGIFMGFFGLVLAFNTGLWKNTVFWLKTIIGVLITGAFLLPFFLPYFPVHKKMGFFWTFNDIRYYSAEIQNYFSVPPWNQFWGQILDTRATPEHQVFLGLIPFLIIIVWLSFNQSLGINYRPYFIKSILAWFSLKKETSDKRKGLPLLLLFLNILIFLLILDILIILSTGGFQLKLGFLQLSSRRLINPILFLFFLSSLRLAIYPGWKKIILKIKKLLAQRASKKSPPFLSLQQPPSSSQIHLNCDLYITMAIIAWLFSLGPIISFKGEKLLTGPYNIFYRWVPGFKSIRVPSRFSVLVGLALAVLCGLAIASFLHSKKIRPSKDLIVIIIAGLILVEGVSIPLPLAPLPNKGQIPPIYLTVAKMPAEAVLLELPLPAQRIFYYQEALPMYYSLFHRHRIVNGYTGFIPPAYSIIREAMESFPSQETIELLERLRVELVLVRTTGYRQEKGREIVKSLAEWPQKFVLLAQMDGDFLYGLSSSFSPKEKIDLKAKRSDKLGLLIENKSLVPDRANLETTKKSTLLANKSEWRVWASSNVVKAKMAIDDSLETGWSTAGLQKENEFFWIDFGQEIGLSEVRLSLKNKLFDFPRNFVLEASQDDINWKIIKKYVNAFPYFDLETIEDLSSYEMRLLFPLTKLRFFRLRLTAGHPLYQWSIQEISCWGREPETK